MGKMREREEMGRVRERERRKMGSVREIWAE